jgi:hypothetical protein
MEPAGEMWSVVMESPNSAMMRAPCTVTAPACLLQAPMVKQMAKNGGSAM